MFSFLVENENIHVKGWDSGSMKSAENSAFTRVLIKRTPMSFYSAASIVAAGMAVRDGMPSTSLGSGRAGTAPATAAGVGG